MEAIVAIIVSSVVSILLWLLNSRSQTAQMARDYSETIKTMQETIDDLVASKGRMRDSINDLENKLDEEISQRKKEQKKLLDGIEILINQLIENNLEPRWRPNGNKNPPGV